MMNLNEKDLAEGRAFVKQCSERYKTKRNAQIAAMNAQQAATILNDVMMRHVDDECFTTQDWKDTSLVHDWLEAQQPKESALFICTTKQVGAQFSHESTREEHV